MLTQNEKLRTSLSKTIEDLKQDLTKTKQDLTNDILITNQTGNILSGTNFLGSQFTLVGNSSGAVANVNNKYFPEVVYGSGKVLYVENVTPVTRNNQIENLQLAINY